MMYRNESEFVRGQKVKLALAALCGLALILIKCN
jgi:hypothetical protein